MAETTKMGIMAGTQAEEDRQAIHKKVRWTAQAAVSHYLGQRGKLRQLRLTLRQEGPPLSLQVGMA